MMESFDKLQVRELRRSGAWDCHDLARLFRHHV